MCRSGGILRAAGAVLGLLLLLPAGVGAQHTVPRPPSETEAIGRAARGALGLSTARGGQAYIVSLPFAADRLKRQRALREQAALRSRILQWVILNLAKAGAVVLALVVLRAVMRGIDRAVASAEVEREIVLQEMEEGGEVLEATEHEIRLQRVAGMIAERPEVSARAIRSWMTLESRVHA